MDGKGKQACFVPIWVSKQKLTPDNILGHDLCSGVVRCLKLGNVWTFVQLFFSPSWPENQLYNYPNIAYLGLITTSGHRIPVRT